MNEEKQKKFNDVFLKVISMVEDGVNISEALDFINFNRGTFYRNIDSQQKSLLDIAKTCNTVCVKRRY